MKDVLIGTGIVIYLIIFAAPGVIMLWRWITG